MKLALLMKKLNQKMRGHYGYYGITLNSRSLDSFYTQTVRLLHKWLNRRGGRRKWNWERIVLLINKWMPLLKPRIYHRYT